MKKILSLITAVALSVLISSCGVGYAYVVNENQNSTQVHLSNNNYRILEKVSGSAEVGYVLIFGGKNKTQQYQNAYSEMIESADLTGSKALINILTEEHIGGVPPFSYTRTITVSAHVIEFVN